MLFSEARKKLISLYTKFLVKDPIFLHLNVLYSCGTANQYRKITNSFQNFQIQMRAVRVNETKITT